MSAIALSSGGCSFLFVRSPPPPNVVKPPATFDCGGSHLWPGIDLAVGAVSFLTFAQTLIMPDDYYPRTGSSSRISLMATSAIVGAVTGTSGFVGLSRISDCRQARYDAAQSSLIRVEHRPAPPSRRAAPDGVSTPPTEPTRDGSSAKPVLPGGLAEPPPPEGLPLPATH